MMQTISLVLIQEIGISLEYFEELFYKFQIIGFDPFLEGNDIFFG